MNVDGIKETWQFNSRVLLLKSIELLRDLCLRFVTSDNFPHSLLLAMASSSDLQRNRANKID